ncbi:MAG: class I SAM-dependent methyltransferase [PVC group bacterium]
MMEKQHYFDRLSSGWHENNSLTIRERELLRDVLPPGELSRGGVVLDLGGGTGRLVEFLLADYPLCCLVLDLSYGMLKEGCRCYGHPSAVRIQADACRLPFSGESVRCIFSFCSFPHFDRQEEVLRECRRVLVPSGVFVILHSCSREEINRFHALQSAPVANDRLPSLERFRDWGTALRWIPERLENSPQRFLVRYRKPPV